MPVLRASPFYYDHFLNSRGVYVLGYDIKV